MQENKHIVRVLSLFRSGKEGLKIATLQFPAAIIPAIGMILKDVRGTAYTLSGIVFERHLDSIWDCQLEDSCDNLVPESELYLVS
ncbi:hypothetical protein B0I18_10288 [Taibaiella chishuiensis]|uniref:Uncharacterized protein n=1 Tax=Taibaiella chishuiensis TaxID=1434707 RepID=A0A2P8D7E5_9BACT|nr:hypothetical protein B0I18_10288 [Taibaiella chishuiensis]